MFLVKINGIVLGSKQLLPSTWMEVILVILRMSIRLLNSLNSVSNYKSISILTAKKIRCCRFPESFEIVLLGMLRNVWCNLVLTETNDSKCWEQISIPIRLIFYWQNRTCIVKQEEALWLSKSSTFFYRHCFSFSCATRLQKEATNCFSLQNSKSTIFHIPI